MLDSLQGLCRLASLTNGDPRIQPAKLAATDLERCSDSVIVSGEVGIRRPDARVSKLMLANLGAERRRPL